ncbi:hypothetical protein [Marinobacter sp.]|uniref:hypothetical protein n=1 Tax=Marinobacter sp. TaxID=50741 RepID=UPI00384B5050
MAAKSPNRHKSKSEEQLVEEFASGADGAPTRNLEPSAPRTHKKINVPFNEYEFQQLEEAANRSGRSKLNYLRWAMLEQAKRDLDG